MLLTTKALDGILLRRTSARNLLASLATGFGALFGSIFLLFAAMLNLTGWLRT